MQVYNIPMGTKSLQVNAYGASGGTTYAPNPPGRGGYLSCIINVGNLTSLYIAIGGQGAGGGPGVSTQGGWNGGGNFEGGVSSIGYGCTGGFGGGASDVRTNATDLNSRLVVAGGGGGAANCYGASGGSGGGLVGTSGSSNSGGGGQGGGQSSGGLGISPGKSGSFGNGGNAYYGRCLGGSYYCSGGAGGGGWYIYILSLLRLFVII
jgi:hypothetical protein